MKVRLTWTTHGEGIVSVTATHKSGITVTVYSNGTMTRERMKEIARERLIEKLVRMGIAQ